MPPIPTASLCAAVQGRRTNSRYLMDPPPPPPPRRRRPLAPSASLAPPSPQFHSHTCTYTHTFSLSLSFSLARARARARALSLSLSLCDTYLHTCPLNLQHYQLLSVASVGTLCHNSLCVNQSLPYGGPQVPRGGLPAMSGTSRSQNASRIERTPPPCPSPSMPPPCPSPSMPPPCPSPC